MRIHSLKPDPKALTGYVVRFSIENCAPDDKVVDYFTGKAIEAAFRQGRNEVRRNLKNVLQFEDEI